MNCINTQLETVAQLWLTLGLGLIHNWVSQSCFALYVGNKHLTYFSGVGTIWDEQASACSFRDTGKAFQMLDSGSLVALSRSVTSAVITEDKTELKHIKNSKYEKCYLCGFKFFSAHIWYMIKLEQPPPKKIGVSVKASCRFFFFFLDYEHSTFHPKLLACGLVVWGLLTLSAAIIHINTLALLFVFKDCPLCVLTALPPTAGFNTGRNVLRELVPPTPASN